MANKMTKKQRDEILADFKRRIEPGNYNKGQYHQIVKSDTLLTDDWYPESPYELDPEKIEQFISNLLKNL